LAKSVGRPARKTGAAAAKERAAAKKRYRSKSVSERQAIVKNRSKAAQKKADDKRYSKSKTKRDAYHRDQAKAKTKAPKKPATCQQRGCKRTDIEFHHQGIDKWLCPTHHAAARRSK